MPIPITGKTDSTADSTRVKADSARVKIDSIKAPIGRFADPPTYEIGQQYECNRTQLFATGSPTP